MRGGTLISCQASQAKATDARKSRSVDIMMS